MPILPAQRQQLVEGLRQLALDAGQAILSIYGKDGEVKYKQDDSPVTEADTASSNVILAGLPKLAPGVRVICEETETEGQPSQVGAGETFILVDPLDGTKEFISRNGEFTVNVALVEGGRPVAGVVYAPAVKRMFLGWREDERGHAFEERDGGPRRRIQVVRPGDDGLVVVASRSHRDAKTDEYLKAFKVKSFASAGSSLKLCMVAAGEADLYPRLGRTMEWDIAAGQAVLEAAGGSVCTLDGAPLRYGKAGLDNPHFVARGA